MNLTAGQPNTCVRHTSSRRRPRPRKFGGPSLVAQRTYAQRHNSGARSFAASAAIESLGHCPSELVLTRRCGDVSDFVYRLRCYGDALCREPAEKFDSDLRASVESTLGGVLPDTACWQCGIGADSVGHGLRHSSDHAMPAFIGSRVDSRPMVAGRPRVGSTST